MAYFRIRKQTSIVDKMTREEAIAYLQTIYIGTQTIWETYTTEELKEHIKLLLN